MTELKISPEFAKAFIKAQSEMTNPKKDSENPYFKSKYADLGAVRDASLPALNNNGIGVLQATTDSEVRTILLHEGGEMLDIGCSTKILYGKPNDPQAQGSGITYARRYGLQSILTLAAEDDDGNKGAEQPKVKNQFAALAETAGQDLKEQAEEARLDKLKLALDDMGSVEEIDGYLEVKYQGKTRLQVLEAMSEVNAKRAETIIRNAKLAVDPENDTL